MIHGDMGEDPVMAAMLVESIICLIVGSAHSRAADGMHAQVSHAWVSLNETCASAETRFVSLATRTAARRRPSVTSLARVALYQLRRQVAAHALHASATSAAWLRRTRDAVHRGAERSGRLLRRTGERGRAWADRTAAQGATWLEGVAEAVRSQAADAADSAHRCMHDHGLGDEVGRAWRSVKRVVRPRLEPCTPCWCRSRVLKLCTSLLPSPS